MRRLEELEQLGRRFAHGRSGCDYGIQRVPLVASMQRVPHNPDMAFSGCCAPARRKATASQTARPVGTQNQKSLPRTTVWVYNPDRNRSIERRIGAKHLCRAKATNGWSRMNR